MLLMVEFCSYPARTGKSSAICSAYIIRAKCSKSPDGGGIDIPRKR